MDSVHIVAYAWRIHVRMYLNYVHPYVWNRLCTMCFVWNIECNKQAYNLWSLCSIWVRKFDFFRITLINTHTVWHSHLIHLSLPLSLTTIASSVLCDGFFAALMGFFSTSLVNFPVDWIENEKNTHTRIQNWCILLIQWPCMKYAFEKMSACK